MCVVHIQEFLYCQVTLYEKVSWYYIFWALFTPKSKCDTMTVDLLCVTQKTTFHIWQSDLLSLLSPWEERKGMPHQKRQWLQKGHVTCLEPRNVQQFLTLIRWQTTAMSIECTMLSYWELRWLLSYLLSFVVISFLFIFKLGNYTRVLYAYVTVLRVLIFLMR